MPSQNKSSPLDRMDMRPGETSTTTETNLVSEAQHVAGDTMPLQSSGDYPTNPTTKHRYGANIGTGVYDPHVQNVAYTTYSIHQSDFDRTAPNSGEGIHAHQYHHARDLGSIPVSSTTVIHDVSGVRREVDPEVFARIAESEMHSREGHRHIEKQVLHDSDNSHEEMGSSDHRRCQIEERRGPQHERDLRRDRESAIAAERERITRERIDTRTGSIHGVFGHGRHRDASIIGRDTDATDFGNQTAGKFDAHRDVLSTSGSEHDRLIGTTVGRERLAREQDAKFTSMLGSRSPSGGSTSYRVGTGAVERNVVSGTGTHEARGFEPGVRGNEYSKTGFGSTSAPDTTGQSVTSEAGKHPRGSSGAGMGVTHDEPRRYDAGDTSRAPDTDASRYTKGKPSMLDKIVGNTEVVIGKTTNNLTMKAKGEERAAIPPRK